MAVETKELQANSNKGYCNIMIACILFHDLLNSHLFDALNNSQGICKMSCGEIVRTR
jgi:hypothetical protein